MRNKFLITGANGQLAKAFISQLTDAKKEVSSFTKEQLDISNYNAVIKIAKDIKPDYIINCAAFNYVDATGEEYDTAFEINTNGVKNLALSSKEIDAFLVHFSTDFVFDGKKDGLYTEEDLPHPVNPYGQSKLEGERILKEVGADYLLLRTSWVFGDGRQNFLYKLSQWAAKADVLKVTANHVSVPSYSEDIARVTLLALEAKLKWLYHLCNSGYASRYELARQYYESMGIEKVIIPVPDTYFKEKVQRPYFTAMSNAKISHDLNITIPDWRDGVNRFCEQMKEGKYARF
ncbi:dTDP-4-dehydrorhamnose reductase [Candidatus Scalindua japonica]|uniref:dTDP-4-dehydrorhamnose reductase n=1 Tax=Candidatus Scalindua japonica TaxID=1284222 RepID=A0A286U4D8_9BACT|nr:dTDP-4-dehydrorhamnose reductase [Candidatus Scalindua japonica]GAX63002.1 dTDP-4-dehydrorhamnose reductase [Candidatus Scalindua japonica]